MLDLAAGRKASGDLGRGLVWRLLLLTLALTHPSAAAYLVEGSPESITSTTTTEMPATKHHSGRHVCTKEQAVTEPVRTRESYCIPSYKSYYMPCESGLCRRIRVVYETAYRDVVKYQVSHKTSYSCCPGWAPSPKSSNGCSKAICKKKCENGGSCLKPDFCGCRPGFAGQYCEKDLDECSLRQHTCSHMCVNTFGSYYCKCHPGYVLKPDGKGCQSKYNNIETTPATTTTFKTTLSTTTAPPTTTERDREELEDYDFTYEFVNLNKRINKIERIVTQPFNETVGGNSLDVLAKLDAVIESQKLLKSRIDNLEKKIDQSRKQMNRRKKKLAGEEEMRLHHITRQISALSQRLDNCACGAANNIIG
ncbi:epidermal growth factor-like protein 8 [Neocloeon triangulifer]|uniref:epidermal growth factor-like protein 8 n=1 Tax=Neocloeon triangulifer TaxID=2078957 RepID=UPI00286F53D3|nr:epidermal growth factor-like protein 8 [Neocloeon triangulifer]